MGVATGKRAGSEHCNPVNILVQLRDMFAVAVIGGKQYRVAKGDRITVDHISGNVGDTVTFDRVLLVADGKKTKIGTPVVKKASVTAKILAQEKGEKIDVRRFKAKVRVRRSRGFRPLITTF